MLREFRFEVGDWLDRLAAHLLVDDAGFGADLGDL